MEMAQKRYHVAMIPSPGMGHLISMIELAKKIVTCHKDFSITLIIPTNTASVPNSLKSFLQSLPKQHINQILLPPTNIDESLGTEIKLRECMVQSLRSIHKALSKLKEEQGIKFSAAVVDFFGIDAVKVIKKLNIPTYLCFGTAALNLLFTFYLPKLDKDVKCEYKDMVEPFQIPGCVPIHGRDFADPFVDRKSETYKGFLLQFKRMRLLDGILVNTFLELEPGAIQTLEEDALSCPPVYPIGPFIQSGATTSPDDDSTSREDAGPSDCLKWLDDQPNKSVLFISFGSGGTLSYAQLNELAIGLEVSLQRFLWVIRSPDDKSSCPSYLAGAGDQSKDDPLRFLPDGFLERTKDRGLVVPLWAPQIKIIKHSSVCGFLTHCGWNSTMESLVHGVPLIAWPLYAEQKTNAVLLTDGLNVALRPKENENGVIERDEIKRVVVTLMEERKIEGKKIHDQALKLKTAAEKALSDDGSSTMALSQLLSKWTESTS